MIFPDGSAPPQPLRIDKPRCCNSRSLHHHQLHHPQSGGCSPGSRTETINLPINNILFCILADRRGRLVMSTLGAAFSLFRSLDGSWNRLWFRRGTSARCEVTKLWRRCPGFFGSFLYTVLWRWRVLKAEYCAFWNFLRVSVCSVRSAGILPLCESQVKTSQCWREDRKEARHFLPDFNTVLQTQGEATSSAVAGHYNNHSASGSVFAMCMCTYI